jgi:hypothetical protein
MKHIAVLLGIVFSFEGRAQSLAVNAPEEMPGLRIVELAARGTNDINEFGSKADWVKIENTGNSAIRLSDYNIFITDDVNSLTKFRLEKKKIDPNGSIIIWCDDQDVTRDQIHTNFKLSSKGETISLTIQQGSQIKIIDQVSYKEVAEDEQRTLLRSGSDLLGYTD